MGKRPFRATSDMATNEPVNIARDLVLRLISAPPGSPISKASDAFSKLTLCETRQVRHEAVRPGLLFLAPGAIRMSTIGGRRDGNPRRSTIDTRGKGCSGRSVSEGAGQQRYLQDTLCGRYHL